MIISLRSLTPFPLTSVTEAVFVASIPGIGAIITFVGSLGVAVVGSSLVSDTLFDCPGLLATATAVLETLGVLAA